MKKAASFTIRTPPGFAFERTVRSHGWYDLPPLRWDAADGRLHVVFHASAGDGAPAVDVGIQRAAPDRLRITHSSGAPAEIRRIVGGMLRLDEDLAPAYARLARQPALAACAAAGGGRLLRAPTVFEDVVKMICTTNCTWSLTRVMVRNLCDHLGAPAPSGARAFPTAAVLAAQPERVFRDTIRAGYRAGFLRALAVRVAGGELDLESLRHSDEATDVLRKRLRSIKGVGDYAADNILRLVGRYDRLGLDSWCRATFKRLYPRTPAKTLDAAIERRYRPFAPYQGLALWLDLTRDWFDREPPASGA